MLTIQNKILLGAKRLLFVDDEPGIRETLSLILRRYGFRVTLAATVPEALEQIKSQEFDLLLCDLNIQREGDGYEVIRAMKDVNPRCISIVLTGFPGVESAVEGIHLAIDDYVIKPAKADTIVALLADKLAARQPRARILSASYDEMLLRMRHMILEREGYSVVSAHGFLAAWNTVSKAGSIFLFLDIQSPTRKNARWCKPFASSVRLRSFPCAGVRVSRWLMTPITISSLTLSRSWHSSVRSFRKRDAPNLHR